MELRLTDEQRERIFSAFEGMDGQFWEQVRNSAQYQSSDYSAEKQKQEYDKAYNNILELKQNYFTVALDRVQEVRDEYSVIARDNVPADEKTGKVEVWKEVLADGTAEQVKDLYEKYKGDEDFQHLIKIAYSKRNDLTGIKVENEIGRYPKELDQIEQFFKAKMNNPSEYIKGLHEVRSLNELGYHENFLQIESELQKSMREYMAERADKQIKEQVK